MKRRLVYQVALGEVRPLWRQCVESMAVYCRRHGFGHHVQTEATLRIVPPNSRRSGNALRLGYLPIFEKFNALPLLNQWDEIAIVDADVFAMPDAGDIFASVPDGYDCAAAVEWAMPVTEAYARKLRSYAMGQYGNPSRRFRNMGVEVVRPSLLRFLGGQSPREFIMRPEFADFVNGVGNYRWATEQTLKNEWLQQCGAAVWDLAWEWNALYGALTTLEGAQFVHFFLSAHLVGDDPLTMLRTGNARARV